VKLLAALFGLMLAIAGVAGFVFLRSAPSDCDDRALEETRSPDGRVGAMVYQRRCGDERTTRVKLWVIGNERTSGDVWAVAGGAAPHARFSGARALLIEAPPGARPLLREESFRGVEISIRER
jgi:hypothetical protein